MSRIVALLFCTMALLGASPGVSAAEVESQWSYKVDPGLGDMPPSLRVSTEGAPDDIITTITALNDETSSVLIERTALNAKGLRLRAPAVTSATYVEFSAVPGSDQDAQPFRWRTLILPKGDKLMEYTGRDELLPPKDFDQYWKTAKKELAAVPLEPKITRETDKDTTTGLLFQVELGSVQGTTIVGWLFVPREAFTDGNPELPAVKKYPAVIIAPGYGGSQGPVDRTAAGYITFGINPRNHGPSRAFWKSPVDHLLYNITNCETYYYKLAYLDCLRAAEFLFSREEVDTKRVGTEGSSQGGLFALALAALEPRIACVSANLIAFSDIPDGANLATHGHHTTFWQLLRENGTTASQVRRSLSYIDGANMATRVKCPVQINMGGQDPVAPYVCGVVVHNRLPKGTKREFNIEPDRKHEGSKQLREWTAAWQKQWLKP